MQGISSPNLFYAFVDFGESFTAQAVCYVVPSAVVADVLSKAHKAWLSATGKKGQQRRDTDFRRFLPDWSKYGIEIGYGAG